MRIIKPTMNDDTISDLLAEYSPAQYPWLWEVFAVVFATLCASYLVKWLLGKCKVRLAKTSNLWDEAMLDAAYKPAYYAIWLLGFSWTLDVLNRRSAAELWDSLAPAREVLIIALLTWYIVRVIGRVEARITSQAYAKAKATTVDKTTVAAVGKLLRIAVIITASLIVLQTLGFSISGVLAFGGIGGIALGFAAKDLLANFFGGLIIYLDRPFAVGDWIRSPDKEIEGTVEHIGWRQTVIRTFDKRPLYVPNGTFSLISVENPSRMTNRRIFETIGIRYDDAAQMRAIVADVKRMLREHEAIDQEQTMIVNFNTFGPSSLDFFVYTFTKTTNWILFHQIKQDILLNILDIILEHGADVAYPTSTVKWGDPLTLTESLRGKLPADFQFDREGASARK